MIAVLIDSIKPGSSGWVAVRHTRKIKVSGANHPDDSVVITTDDNGGFGLVGSDKDFIEFDIPENVFQVKAEIVKIGEGSRISVDLE